MSEENNVGPVEAPATPDLKVVDLENVIRIIDAAARRGAFQGSELSGVGQVRDRIESFVNFVKPTEEVPSESTDETPAE